MGATQQGSGATQQGLGTIKQGLGAIEQSFGAIEQGFGATKPFTVGDIKVTSYSFIGGMAQVIPVLTYYAGDCSFKFQK